ncbi:acyl carrier protein [Streptomyces sp. NPDC058108]|uniref:acyl carrier protein n=1 Tax=Streptomyces sp. NPDC058108 TaxID=3346344 RepID=UPI0036EB03CD
MPDSISTQVKKVLVDILDLDLPAEDIRDDASLYSTTISLDSLTLLHVITEIERRFDCEIDDEAVMTADLVDVGSLVDLVRSQLALAGVGPELASS